MKRKALPLLTAGVMMLSLAVLPAAAEDSAPGYSDVEGTWAQSAIERWSGHGVVKGDDTGSFNPSSNITVAELATVLDNLMGYTAKAGSSTFADLKGTEWYADAVLKLAAAGILKGDGVNINAESPIDRERATVILARALSIRPDADADLDGFTDGSSASDWSAGYIKAMADAGIITGVSDGVLALGHNIDRASVMTIMDKSVSDYITEGGSHTLDSKGITIVKSGEEVTLTGTAKDVILAPAAADGSLTLDKTNVTGAITVNAESAQLVAKDAKLTDVTVNASGASVDLQGKSSSQTVVVAEDASGASLTVAKDAKVESATMAASGTTASISGTVKNVAVTDTAADTQLTVEKGGKVDTLTTDSASKVQNNGTLGKLENNVSGNIVDGNKPQKIDTPTGVEPPKNSSGQEVKPGTSTGGGSNTPAPTNVSTQEQLLSALSNSGIAEIVLVNDIEVDLPLTIKRSVTLDGGGYKITGKIAEGAEPTHRSTILLFGAPDARLSGITLKNLTVAGINSTSGDWDRGEFGIQAYCADKVTLHDVSVEGANAALQVNSSDVTLTGATTLTGNEYGIEVVMGEGTTVKSSLTVSGTLVNGSESANRPTVWLDLPEQGTVTGEGLLMYKVGDKAYYFLDAANSGAESKVDGVLYGTLADALSAAADGKTVELVKDAQAATVAVKANTTLTIPSGKTLTVTGTLTVDGTLDGKGVVSGGALAGSGTVKNPTAFANIITNSGFAKVDEPENVTGTLYVTTDKAIDLTPTVTYAGTELEVTKTEVRAGEGEGEADSYQYSVEIPAEPIKTVEAYNASPAVMTFTHGGLNYVLNLTTTVMEDIIGL